MIHMNIFCPDTDGTIHKVSVDFSETSYLQETFPILLARFCLSGYDGHITKRAFHGKYPFSDNHGSGKWLYLKGNDPIGDTPIFH